MIWSQHWSDVLFLHFPAPASQLRPLLPSCIELDTFAGDAWLSYVVFRLKVRPRFLPHVPWLSTLVELNVRTYVRHQGEAGICFLGIHANNPLAIRAARVLTPLRYERARLEYEWTREGHARIDCRSSAVPGDRLELEFRPSAPPAPAPPNSLDAWLLERYRLYVCGRGDALLAADVWHAPWHTSPVNASISTNTWAARYGLSPSAPLERMHFSPGVQARFGSFKQVAAVVRPERSLLLTTSESPPSVVVGSSASRR